MFRGKVMRAFVDRVTKARYPVGSTYFTDSEDRMNEIVAVGKKRGVVYVEFDDSGEGGEKQLSEMTVSELRAYAHALGVKLTATKKADIITEIEAELAADGD